MKYPFSDCSGQDIHGCHKQMKDNGERAWGALGTEAASHPGRLVWLPRVATASREASPASECSQTFAKPPDNEPPPRLTTVRTVGK